MKRIDVKNKNLRIFKGIAYSFSLITCLSCADLENDPTEFNIPPQSFATTEGIETAVTGLYERLRNASQWTTFYAPAWAGDDITTFKGGNKADFREFDQRNVDATNGRLLNNFRDLYSLIKNVNSVLDRVSDVSSIPEIDQDRADVLMGEAYFLRGLAFHHLARVHGRIPIDLSVSSSGPQPLPSQETVYGQIESDFLEAESRLPEIYPNVLAGAPRPNKGSARALLARLYMDWAGFPLKDESKYVQAASSAKQVIDNKDAHGFDLLENVSDLWLVANKFNKESVYTISYASGLGLANLKYGILGLPGGTDFRGWDETYAEIRYFEDFPEGPRKEATYRTEIGWETFPNQQSPVFAKVAGPKDDIDVGQFRTDRNDFYIRYAEVLLIYAEASARSNNANPEAWEALNKIRRRAEGLPFETPDSSIDVTSGDLADLVVTERKWEFAGEYLRWYDLIRLELVQEALSNRDPRVSEGPEGTLLNEPNPIIGSLGTENYFSPLPAAILEEVPSLK